MRRAWRGAMPVALSLPLGLEHRPRARQRRRRRFAVAALIALGLALIAVGLWLPATGSAAQESALTVRSETPLRSLATLAIGDELRLRRTDGVTYVYEVTALDVVDSARAQRRRRERRRARDSLAVRRRRSRRKVALRRDGAALLKRGARRLGRHRFVLSIQFADATSVARSRAASSAVKKVLLDEPIHLQEPSEDWAPIFAAERQRLEDALRLPVEHVGSTAVPGLLVKPIVDIQVGVPTFPPAMAVTQTLERLGYENLSEAGVPGRMYWRLRGPRSFNIHVVRMAGEHWRNSLALRDYLRTSHAARERYAEAKRAAVAAGAVMLLAYSQAKNDVVASLLSQAQAHADSG